MIVKRKIQPGILAGLVLLSLHPEAIANDAETLARSVPADVGLFVEARDCEDLLIALSEPQLWVTLADVAGQPAEVADTKVWEQRIRDTIGMGTTEAIQRLFSEQVAFVGPAPGRSQDAAILCRPRASVKPLLEGWKARPLPYTGRASSYRLFANLGLALWGETACFGDPQHVGGVYQRVLGVVDSDGKDSLAADPTFLSLRKRLPSEYDAMLFARFPETNANTATQPAEGGTPIAVLAVMKRQGSWLDFRIVSNRDDEQVSRADLRDLLRGLPKDALAHWAGDIAYDELLGSASTLPNQSVLRIALQLMDREGGLREMLTKLRGPTVLLAGTAKPMRLVEDAPDVPVLALVVNTTDAAAVRAQLDTTFTNAVSVYNLLALQRGWALVDPPVSQTIAQVESRIIDLRALLGPEPENTAIGELELCWALDGDELIIATHSSWLSRIIRSRHQTDILQGAEAGRVQAPRTSRSVELQTGAVAELGGQWLKYLQTSAPAVLEEQWWRQFQPGGGSVRLGIVATQNVDGKFLAVDRVAANSPMAGVIQVGDRIVGCDKKRFATVEPAQEFRQALIERPHARWIDLMIERGDARAVNRRIPIPFFNPVEALRRLEALQSLVSEISYAEYRAPNESPERRLRLKLQSMSPADETDPAQRVQPQSAESKEEPESDGNTSGTTSSEPR